MSRRVDGVAMEREGQYVEQSELKESETRWQVPVEFGEHARGAHELDSLVIMAGQPSHTRAL